MCGIAGYLNLNGEPASAQVVSAMGAMIAHRGPDGEALVHAVIAPEPVDEAREAFVGGGLRREAMVTRNRVDIGEGARHVALLHAHHFDLGLAPAGALDDPDHAHQIFGPVVADIVDRMRGHAAARFGGTVICRRRVEAGDHAAHDIVLEPAEDPIRQGARAVYQDFVHGGRSFR